MVDVSVAGHGFLEILSAGKVPLRLKIGKVALEIIVSKINECTK